MKDSTRRSLRTAVATGLGLVVAAPAVYEAVGGDATAATGWLAAVLTLCTAITRVMAIPAVDRALSRLGLGTDERAELLDQQ